MNTQTELKELQKELTAIKGKILSIRETNLYNRWEVANERSVEYEISQNIENIREELEAALDSLKEMTH